MFFKVTGEIGRVFKTKLAGNLMDGNSARQQAARRFHQDSPGNEIAWRVAEFFTADSSKMGFGKIQVGAII